MNKIHDERWAKNKAVHRLALTDNADQDSIQTIRFALDNVLSQSLSVPKGFHALLIVSMREVFGVNLSKCQAVEGALFALWEDNDILSLSSHEQCVQQLQDEYREQQAHDNFYAEMDV